MGLKNKLITAGVGIIGFGALVEHIHREENIKKIFENTAAIEAYKTLGINYNPENPRTLDKNELRKVEDYLKSKNVKY